MIFIFLLLNGLNLAPSSFYYSYDGHSPALAAEAIRLKPGKNQGKIIQNCMTCHSLDYIEMNAGVLDQKGWEAEVNKMIRTFGAPVPEKDAPLIVEYLTENYGKK